jgi:geranylgeranyl diphosphate synthase type I
MTTPHRLPQPFDSARADLWPRQRELLGELLVSLGGAGHPLHRAVADEVDQGGKRLRAGLPHATARALARSFDEPAALWLGLALELLHVATLCHDDVMDGDRVRRDRPTAWRRLGVAGAITLGDYLFFVAQEAVLRAPLGDAEKLLALRELARAAQEVARGQALEDARRASSELPTRAECAAIARGKTGGLLAAALRFGGLAAGHVELDALGSIGADLGFVYQLADDLADLDDDSDLWEGKPTWMVAYAREELVAAQLYRARSEKSAGDVAAIRAALEASGAREAAERRIECLARGLLLRARAIDVGLAALAGAILVRVVGPRLAAPRSQGGAHVQL